ncbi:MAG: ABC transporter permease [Bacteroidota bacterium]
MKNFNSLIAREFKLIRKNSVILAIFIGAPILYAILLGAVYSDAKATELPVIVADLDNSPLSDKFIDALNDNQYISVNKIIYQNNSSVENELIKDNYHAVITIPARFEADINQKRHPEIDVDVDAANMLTANYVSTGIMRVLGTLNAGIEIAAINKKGVPVEIAKQQFEAFKISMNRHYNPSSNYLHFLAPGMLGTVMQQVFLLALALSFTQEFENKTFNNLVKQSSSSISLIFTKSLPYWIIGLALWFPLFYLSSKAFHLPTAENQFAYWLLTSLFFISLAFIGIAVSSAINSQLKATEILMVIATPSFILSGQTWPLSQMPEWIQGIASAIPLTHYLEGIRKLLMYKADLTDIVPQLIPLIIITVVSFVISVLNLKFKIRKTLALIDL